MDGNNASSLLRLSIHLVWTITSAQEILSLAHMLSLGSQKLSLLVSSLLPACTGAPGSQWRLDLMENGQTMFAKTNLPLGIQLEIITRVLTLLQLPLPLIQALLPHPGTLQNPLEYSALSQLLMVSTRVFWYLMHQPALAGTPTSVQVSKCQIWVASTTGKSAPPSHSKLASKYRSPLPPLPHGIKVILRLVLTSSTKCWKVPSLSLSPQQLLAVVFHLIYSELNKRCFGIKLRLYLYCAR